MCEVFYYRCNIKNNKNLITWELKKEKFGIRNNSLFVTIKTYLF